MGYIEEEKSSEQGDVESSNESYSYEHDNASSTSTITQQNRSSAVVPNASKNCKNTIVAFLCTIFLLTIVLVVAISTSPAEKNITANKIVGINSNDKEQQPLKILT